MPVQTKTFEVDGDQYEITQLGAKQGRKLWLKLLHSIAPAIKELSKSEVKTLDKSVVLAALSAAIENLDDATTEALYEAYGATCTVLIRETGNTPNLTGAVFDQHFAAKYVSMSKWLWECTSYNFGSFLSDTSFGSVKSLFKRVAAETLSKSESPKDSTGSSGES